MLVGLLAAALTAAVTPLALSALRRRGVVDLPNHRSSHDHPVPRAGGIAVVIGGVAAAALSPLVSADAGLGVLAAACTFGAIGAFEDLVGVPPFHRLAFQAAAAAAAVPLLLSSLLEPGLWEIPLMLAAFLWIISYVNAFNFMDGINGLSVAATVVAGGTWWAIGGSEELPSLASGGAILVGMALGFAPFNVPRARVFLGDVGSYFLGAWVAALAILGLEGGLPLEAVVAPLALYLADTGTTLLRRVARGECWYSPHRDHTYQRLVRLGWSHSRTTMLVTACVLACSGLGAVSLGGSPAARAAADVALVGVLVGYLALPGWLSRTLRVAVPAGA